MSSSLLSSEKMINNIGNGGTRLIIWETLNLLFGKSGVPAKKRGD